MRRRGFLCAVLSGAALPALALPAPVQEPSTADRLAEQVERRTAELKRDMERTIIYDVHPHNTPLMDLVTSRQDGAVAWVQDELKVL